MEKLYPLIYYCLSDYLFHTSAQVLFNLQQRKGGIVSCGVPFIILVKLVALQIEFHDKPCRIVKLPA